MMAGSPTLCCIFARKMYDFYFCILSFLCKCIPTRKKMVCNCMCVCIRVCIPYLMGNNNLMGKLTLKDDQNLDKLRSKAMCESIEVEMRGQDMLFSRTLR